jgi:hypothetical protein
VPGPLIALVPLLSSTAVKAIVAGRNRDPDEWAAVSGRLIVALLAEQAETTAALRRIEAKLDRLQVQAFETALGSGLDLLQEAQRRWRKPAERKRALRDARLMLIQAVNAAPDLERKVEAKSRLAIAWLLSGSAPDERAVLDEAVQLLSTRSTRRRRSCWTSAHGSTTRWRGSRAPPSAASAGCSCKGLTAKSP